MARFRLAARAAADLDEIWFTIALDNVDAADRIIDSLYAAAERLALQPRMGRKRNELAAELRSFVTKTPYLIYYEPAPDGIFIVRILHHARDVEAIFPNAQDED